ncbi:MAG: YbjQ family protein [Actinobacteria bacterium]|nr:YbjQ family protein [Actinomycetota bacterium]
MLISTMNDVPGRTIQEVYGEVFGLTVRSRGLKGQFSASFKSLVGGELGSLTDMLHEGRQEAIERMVAEAEAKGANAIIAMRFDSSEMMEMGTEVVAYGTAVKLA